MKNRRILVLDAFTETPFEGNPCGIIPDADGLTDETMQRIAKEMNLPETSFVLSSKVADFRVRYFTPLHELGFAGHPTIATSFMLAQEGAVKLERDITTINLEFNIGVLPVDIYAENGKPVQAVMTLSQPNFGLTVDQAEIADCFSEFSREDFISECPPQVTGTGTNFLIIGLKSADKLQKLDMKREKLCKVVDKCNVDAAYIFTTSEHSGKTVMTGRLADPRGTFEDPFTGSAIGAAGAYMIHHGLSEANEIQAEQGQFIGRPGFGKLMIRHSNGNIESIKLGGTAVKVTDGLMFMRKN